ncbi:ABC transporter ATP-binding protein [Streptomyces spiralis]|uniref:ABC transporter ATP-binding protein n=1 Tax=Streptomyces spiralis TaxID=66376 RepID=UPI0036808F36
MSASDATLAGGSTQGLCCRDVTVTFGELTAVDAVTADFASGKVHVLVGQNGAGKTTLSRVLGGLIRPSAGAVAIGGRRLHAGSVLDARSHGVELVHQHFALPPDFMVAEVFELFSAAPRRFGAFGARRVKAEARELLTAAGIDVDPSVRVGRLPVETRQAIEITRALASSPRVLILDEPTAVLPPPAVQRLFERLHELAALGICVIVVLHKLAEVAAVADTVSVLRGGRLVLPPTPAGDVERGNLDALIMGQAPVSAVDREAPPLDPAARTVLNVSGVSCHTGDHDAPVREVSLRVRRGEIVGIAGVEGNGQRSLAEAITGLARLDAGDIHLAGQSVRRSSARERRAQGLRAIPFERNTEGVSLTSTIWENYNASANGTGGRRRALISPRALREQCRTALRPWEVAYRSVSQQIGELSGGNIQRVVLARELRGRAQLLVAAHPTRGLDVGGSRFVRNALTTAADQGAGVLLISSDLDELFALAHRLVVLYAGRIAAEFTAPFDLQNVGRAMTGGARG